jgi:selenocysteine-specific translation elongation factor
MKHLVLGTAGHVDHGKTALVKALTGVDTDRLKEEKERGIQVHNLPVEKAQSGQRPAINLRGIEKSAVERGDVLVRAQTVWPSKRMDVFIEFLASNSKNLKNMALIRLHTGRGEMIARIILHKAQLIKDGRATPASFNDLTGLSRKYIIPLMEYFDMSKLTVRAGDHRILREKA